jgi:hypothetical protein
MPNFENKLDIGAGDLSVLVALNLGGDIWEFHFLEVSS